MVTSTNASNAQNTLLHVKMSMLFFSKRRCTKRASAWRMGKRFLVLSDTHTTIWYELWLVFVGMTICGCALATTSFSQVLILY